MESKCLVEFCTRVVNPRSRIIQFGKLCRSHQTDALEALDSHMPHTHVAQRLLFLQEAMGRSWFSDWVRMVECSFLNQVKK